MPAEDAADVETNNRADQEGTGEQMPKVRGDTEAKANGNGHIFHAEATDEVRTNDAGVETGQSQHTSAAVIVATELIEDVPSPGSTERAYSAVHGNASPMEVSPEEANADQSGVRPRAGAAPSDVSAPPAEGTHSPGNADETPAAAQAGGSAGPRAEHQLEAAMRRRGLQRQPLPPPVDLENIHEMTSHPPLSPSSNGTSRGRNDSSPKSTGTSGRRRRSPKNMQLALNKQIEELCSRSVHAAARYGIMAKLQDHLGDRALSNQKDSAGFTPLHFSACYGHIEALGLLLESQADVNAANEHGWTPLHVAGTLFLSLSLSLSLYLPHTHTYTHSHTLSRLLTHQV